MGPMAEFLSKIMFYDAGMDFDIAMMIVAAITTTSATDLIAMI